MADINLEKKSGPSPWVWVAGLLVLALVVWGVVEYMGDGGVMDEQDTAPAAEQYPTEYETQPPVPRTEPYDPPPTDPADPNAPGTSTPGTTEPGTPGQPGVTDPNAGTGG
ncbi:MAG TPA: hypothetical protein VK929_02765 [Longimicrobiales bacterium]|nr:hypothetical protein [Longimicrobiales bacterium]